MIGANNIKIIAQGFFGIFQGIAQGFAAEEAWGREGLGMSGMGFPQSAARHGLSHSF
jgi:hypothetical protein